MLLSSQKLARMVVSIGIIDRRKLKSGVASSSMVFVPGSMKIHQLLQKFGVDILKDTLEYHKSFSPNKIRKFDRTLLVTIWTLTLFCVKPEFPRGETCAAIAFWIHCAVGQVWFCSFI